jgi:hypothetical protein
MESTCVGSKVSAILITGFGSFILTLGLAGCGTLTDSRNHTNTGQVVTQSPEVPSPPPTASRADLPPELELQRLMQVREATRSALLTNVPQETIGPEWVPSPWAWSTPLPIAMGLVRSAGAGEITEDGQVAFYSSLFSIKNQWYAEINGQRIGVYAGSSKSDSAQGLLIVDVRPDNSMTASGVYSSPLQAGPLRIVGAQAQQLIVTSRSNAMFVFDLVSRQWISPLPAWIDRPVGTGTIHESGQSDLPPGAGLFENQWSKQVGQQEIRVYAGAEVADNTQGLVVVTVSAPGQPRTVQSYQTPIRKGPVRIVDASGDRLILTSEKQLFIFDITSRQWVSPLSGPSPSPIQSPLPSPSPSPLATMSPLATLTP